MKTGELMVMVVIVAMASLFGYVMISARIESACVNGTVTDKYILTTFKGEPVYYLVLDDEFDTEVTEKKYYKHKLGDYYDPCGDT